MDNNPYKAPQDVEDKTEEIKEFHGTDIAHQIFLLVIGCQIGFIIMILIDLWRIL